MFKLTLHCYPRTICLIAMLCLCWAVAPAFGRVWTDVKGRTIEADFVGMNDRAITIRRSSDGKVFNMPLEAFSENDHTFVHRESLPHVLEEKDILRKVDGVPSNGKAGGLSRNKEGKSFGYFVHFFSVSLPGFTEKQSVGLGYIEDSERGTHLECFLGPGFVYDLKDGKFILRK